MLLSGKKLQEIVFISTFDPVWSDYHADNFTQLFYNFSLLDEMLIFFLFLFKFSYI